MPLRRSKSLFGTDKLDTEGYLDATALRKQNLVNSAADDDDEDDNTDGEEEEQAEGAGGLSSGCGVGLLGGENPEGEANSSSCQGGPFSALTPSMWPSKGNSTYKLYCVIIQSCQAHSLKFLKFFSISDFT